MTLETTRSAEEQIADIDAILGEKEETHKALSLGYCRISKIGDFAYGVYVTLYPETIEKLQLDFDIVRIQYFARQNGCWNIQKEAFVNQNGNIKGIDFPDSVSLDNILAEMM